MFKPPPCPVFAEAHKRGYIAASKSNGYGLLFKRIVADTGDTVSITSEGVFVNGSLLKNSKPFPYDATGAPLPKIKLQGYTIKTDEAFFMSNHIPESFDARYFGPQKKSQINCVVKPVLVF